MFNSLFGTSTDSEVPNSTEKITVYSLLMTAAVVSGLWIGTGIPVHFAEVSGTSMEPTLSEGDLLVGFETNSIETGDVVIVQDESCFESEYVVHRVVDVTDNGYVTQGDNNPITDQGQTGCGILSESSITAEIIYSV
mgnify:CR=1 FL=1